MPMRALADDVRIPAESDPGRDGRPDQSSAAKRLRAAVPRSSHGVWDPPADRPDPVALLEEQAADRVAELVPIRYGRMLASPFSFFRGAALVMASDLATTPRSGITVQACGDAHLSNFGLYASPERNLVFDINDFDETLPGPWEWDVKRLAASLAVAGRHNGFTRAARDDVARGAVRSYRLAMREYAAMTNLDVWYSSGRVQAGLPRVRALLDRRSVAAAERVVRKARSRTHLHALERLTTVVDGQRRIVSAPPLVVPVEELGTPEQVEEFTARIRGLVGEYGRTLQPDRRHLLETYRYVHLARKVVGVGSVGSSASIVLMAGRDADDPLFLQVKQATASVLARFVGPGRYQHQGRRVVEGQRLMQAVSDIFLGWQRVAGPDGVTRDFYVRQLRDWKGSWEPEAMPASGMAAYGAFCGQTLARAHARSGDRAAIAAYLGGSESFDKAVAGFAERYADQNERDYEALRAAVETGRVTASSEV